ncbi:MAG TPA: site-specific integrase [Thermoanaerobaculia bacterium]|nr:site-specific integrase [Thermoanaerobaculia bacterium]
MTDKIQKTPVSPGAIQIAPAITKDPMALYLLSLQSKESRRTQRSALKYVAAMLGVERIPWEAVTYAHALAVRDRLGETLAPATAQRYFAAFRGVLREAWRSRLLDDEEWRRIDDISAPKGSSPDTGRSLSGPEIRRLLAACPNTYEGRRDAALVALSVFAGLRRFEVAGLDLADFNEDTGELHIRGKGRKERTVRLATLARGIVVDWLVLRGGNPGPLLYSRTKGSPIGYSTVDAILKRIAARAKVDHFTPHDFRRTFVTRILEMTGDLAIAQKAAGHAQPATTVRYDKRKAEAAMAATERLDEGV